MVPQPEVTRWFYGVFEGGGAKGVAYQAALEAMDERNSVPGREHGIGAWIFNGRVTLALKMARR